MPVRRLKRYHVKATVKPARVKGLTRKGMFPKLELPLPGLRLK